MLVYLGIPRGHDDVSRSFSSLVNCESYSTRAWFPRIKRVLHTGVFPAKTSTCSWLFAARVENDLQEIPCYVATDK